MSAPSTEQQPVAATTQQQQQEQQQQQKPASPQEELKNKGNEQFAQKKYKKAIDFYDQAIKIDPNSDEAGAIHSNRAACFFNLEDFEETLKSADECIRIRPEWHRGYFRRACALEKLQKIDEAIVSYDKAIALEPKDSDAHGGKLRCINILKSAELANMTDEEKKKKNAEAVENIRKKLMSMNEKDRKANADRFMLHGCHSKDISVVKMALECGADPNPPPPPCPIQFSALLIAVDRHANDIVELLLEHKADTERAVEANKTPLIVASLIGNFEAVKLLVQFEANIEAETADNQTRPLHLACHNGHAEIAQFLVDIGASINARDKLNATPLTWAVVRGHVECVRVLLEAGADQLNSGPSAKETILIVAAGAGQGEVTKLLLEKFVGEADEIELALIEAIKNNQLDSAVELLSFYADLARDGFLPLKSATTILGHAVAKEEVNFEIVKAILKHVKDTTRAVMTPPAANGKQAISAGQAAIIQNNKELLKLFIESKNFDINAGERDEKQAGQGYTLLHLAARHTQTDLIKFLLSECKANPKVAGNDGLTPLHLAAANGSIRCMRLFLEAGINVNTAADPTGATVESDEEESSSAADNKKNQNDETTTGSSSGLATAPGATPLVFAAFGGYHNAVIELIQKGARVDCQVDGRTVLELICGFKTLVSVSDVGHHEVVKALLNVNGSDGACVFSPEVLKNSYDAAVENKHRSIADLIKKKMK